MHAGDRPLAREAGAMVAHPRGRVGDVEYLVLAASAAALSLLLTPVVRAAARRIGAVDDPGPRRVHVRPTPRLGGLAVLVAVLGALALNRYAGGSAASVLAAPGRAPALLVAGFATILVTGVVDDLVGLPVAPKLVLQVLAATLAVAGGYALAGFTNPLTGHWLDLGRLGGVLTVAWIVAITNAINLIDGLDGLATGMGVIASTALCLVCLAEGRHDAAGVWAALGGGLAGFLAYNFPPASIFLGDTGSLLIGYAMAVLALESLAKSATAVVVLAPVLALGLPVADMALAVLRRLLATGVGGIVRADQGHIHHRLVGDGMSHRAAVLLLYGVCAAFGAVSVLAVVAGRPATVLAVGTAAFAIAITTRWLRARGPR
jgi:UDP-GlcNAc:undecaprenyl-phosphate GlcNAc-1-phosphate transferase